MLGDYDDGYGLVPVLSTWSGRIFTALLAVIELGSGGWMLLMAFMRHDLLYDFPALSAIGIAVVALFGFILFHDAMHRFGAAVRGR